ncbi:MAG: hypothetical protein AAGM21_10120 [Pseudomonadota bacterium]
MTPYQTITYALSTALNHYQETMGEAFPTKPELDDINDPEFGAVAEMVGDVFTIRVSTGTLAATQRLWRDAKATEVMASLNATGEELTHVSLVWLMLHEMHHYEMEHFQIVDRAYLTETFGAHQFAIAKRAKVTESPAFKHIPPEDRHKVEPCLEMQADHDAIEMVIDAYSPDEWPSLRARAAAISAMMMLIEREDAKHDQEHSSHPKAATRIFQLLRYLTQMPTIQLMVARQHAELGIEPHIPSEEEVLAYTAEVLVPCFYDAVALARTGNATTIASDLGDQESFFKDVEATLHELPKPSWVAATRGAGQWVTLMEVNGKLKQ